MYLPEEDDEQEPESGVYIPDEEESEEHQKTPYELSDEDLTDILQSIIKIQIFNNHISPHSFSNSCFNSSKLLINILCIISSKSFLFFEM